MDLKQFDTRAPSEDGADMPVLGPDDEPFFKDGTDDPVTIRLMGNDSPTFEREQHRIAKGRKGLKISRSGVKLDSRQAKLDLIQMMAACTISWDGIDYDGESPYPCTRQNAIRLYTDLPWLRDQVVAFMEDRMNFLGEASRDSSSSPVKSSA